MSDRDELAALMKDRLREVYMTATASNYTAAFVMDDDPLNDVVVDGHVDFIDLADAILTRWRLVPVDLELSDRDAIRRYYNRVRESHPSPSLLAAVNEAEANDERLWAHADTAPPPAEKFNAITDWREPVPGWSFTTGKTPGSAIIERWYDYPEAT